MTSLANISIRPFAAWHEYLAAEELQREVWHMPDWRDVVPANLLITAHKNGGIVLGAFDPADRLVGFAFSFLGVANSAGQKIPKHCSHMLAVLPDYQGQKLGEQLKFKQREAALAQGIALMTWTYDPLLALNAHLNLFRLGALARHYIVNAYGEMTDALNAGLPSDRFEVEWWLNMPRVQACALNPPLRQDWNRVLDAGASPVFDVAFDVRALPRIVRVHKANSATLLLEIPADLNAIKSADAALAKDWRMQTRETFLALFDGGYAASDFVFSPRGEARRAAYILSHASED